MIRAADGVRASRLFASDWAERIREPRRRFRRDVLAASHARRCDHVLPAAADAAGAGTLPQKQVPDASGLFNLMRNLGGAIGIALIDTVLYGRTAGHADALRERLIAGDVDCGAGDRA